MAILNPKYKGIRKSKKKRQSENSPHLSALIIDSLPADVVSRFHSISKDDASTQPRNSCDTLVYLLDIADLVEKYGVPME